MSQRVPNCYMDDTPATTVRSSTAADIPTLDYEVAELTWENGQLALHGLGPPRVPAPNSKYSTGGAGGTLESIVDQATRLPNPKSTDELISGGPWFHHRSSRGGMDALVPCSVDLQDPRGSTRVGSCSDGRRPMGDGKKRARVAPEWSMSGFTSTSMGSPDNTIDDHDYSVCHSHSQMEDEEEEEEEEEKKVDDGKSSVSTKRSRAAAIHNQSERKRRDKINQRMKTLQKLVPNSSKTDKASMLDEVIEYLKQLQAQVSMMSRMNMPPASMMLPMAAMQQQQQQQLHLSLMSNPMALGMPGLGLLDFSSMNRAAAAAVAASSTNIAPNLQYANMMIPNPFASTTTMQASHPSWDHISTSNESSRFQQSPLIPDPMAAFLACSSSHPTTMEAYSRMLALYQQMQQQQQLP